MDAGTLNKKIELIQWLSTVEDRSVIEKLMKFRKEANKDWWNIVSAEEKASIEKGLEEADKGHLSPHTTARKLYERWL